MKTNLHPPTHTHTNKTYFTVDCRHLVCEVHHHSSRNDDKAALYLHLFAAMSLIITGRHFGSGCIFESNAYVQNKYCWLSQLWFEHIKLPSVWTFNTKSHWIEWLLPSRSWNKNSFFPIWLLLLFLSSILLYLSFVHIALHWLCVWLAFFFFSFTFCHLDRN